MKITTTGTDNPLAVQVWVPRSGSTPLRQELFQEARREVTQLLPSGGVWTSSHTPGAPWPCDWLRHCVQTNLVRGASKAFLYRPLPESRILVVDSRADLTALLDAYGADWLPGSPRRTFDPALVRGAGFHAVHVTSAGIARNRMTVPDRLAGYASECTFWLTLETLKPAGEIDLTFLSRVDER